MCSNSVLFTDKWKIAVCCFSVSNFCFHVFAEDITASLPFTSVSISANAFSL